MTRMSAPKRSPSTSPPICCSTRSDSPTTSSRRSATRTPTASSTPPSWRPPTRPPQPTRYPAPPKHTSVSTRSPARRSPARPGRTPGAAKKLTSPGWPRCRWTSTSNPATAQPRRRPRHHRRRIRLGCTRPAVVVETGHGLHAYWVISDGKVIDADIGPARALLKRWAAWSPMWPAPTTCASTTSSTSPA